MVLTENIKLLFAFQFKNKYLFNTLKFTFLINGIMKIYSCNSNLFFKNSSK